MSEPTTEKMARLIDSGQPRKVIRLYGGGGQSGAEKDIRYLFFMHLAHRLLGNNTEADAYMQRVKSHQNYSSTLEGDLLRDQALALLRQNKPKAASVILDEVEAIHQGDANRIAALKMCRGRISFSRQQYARAIAQHSEANQQWFEIDNLADPQWMMNNNFHWFRSLIASGQRQQAKSLYADIVRVDPSRKRRTITRVIWWLGPVGDWLYRQSIR